MLCTACLGALLRYDNVLLKREMNEDYWKTRFGHHCSVQSLLQSVDEGCFVCGVFWREHSAYSPSTLKQDEHDTVLADNRPVWPTDDNYFTVLDIQWTKEHIEFWVKFSKHSILKHSDTQGCHSFLCERLFEPEFQTQIIPTTLLTSHTTASDDSMKAAQLWLHQCQQHHETCNEKGSVVPWYPTRLLHLGNLNTHESSIRLIHTAQETPTGPYTTLSHCWGKADFLKLTRHNLSDFCNKIRFMDISKTFREAVVVSKRLGIQYLWIDSLCIIQDKDDLSDWLQESCLMQKVYSHSHCNISASVSEDGSQGLFRSRDPRFVRGPRINLPTSGPGDGSALVTYQVLDAESWKKSVVRGILQTSGWVFQERMLAPRVLHFGHDQLLWECRETMACESHCSELSELENGETNITSITRRWRSLPRPQVNGMIFGWDSCSVPGDKLIALSGIAKTIATLTQDTYICGMWRENLAFQLLWFNLRPSNRPCHYRAPTWSWASAEGHIAWHEYGTDRLILFEVKDFIVNHATEDTTGCVTGGYIDVRGCLEPMTLLPNLRNKSDPRWMISVDNCTARFAYDIHAQLDACEADDSTLAEDSSEGRLFFLHASITSIGLLRDFSFLLLRVVDMHNGIFIRIGIATYYGAEDDNKVMPSLDESAKSQIPCMRYSEGLHTIRIV